ncbi:MAG: hypothetical protein CVU50_09745 [Candidatus Cloacimonetes bacterium HGW-Cloacimonetes-3]|jgi:hypothetical protein|nr:MAG: hypothetical protein CVU50_09745 [Candidatus Cloacimonetes bacterium HGW-Cloacimonetes-3]
MKLIDTLLILALLLPCVGSATTRTVRQDGSGDYTAVQTALDASQPGDSVLVHPGRYYENLIIGTNNISLISLEAVSDNPAHIDSTVIDGTLTNPCLRVSQGKTNIYIRGLSFTNGLSVGSGGGISFSSGSSASLINCKVFGNTANFGGGINVIGATVTFSGVEISDNYSKILGGGLMVVSITGYPHAITFDPLNRCSIYNNRSGSGQDIFIQDATGNQNVYLDTFSVDNPASYYAIFKTQNNADYHMNIDILNAHHQEINSDIYISPDGDDDNDGLSPASSLKTIHEGIYRIASDSLNQKTVHLMPGTYSRTANDQVFPIALKSWVIVQGSGMENTVVVGEPHPQIPVSYGSADSVFMTYIEPVLSMSDFSITTMGVTNGNAIVSVWDGCMNLKNMRIHNVNPDYIASVLLWHNSERDVVWDNVIVENEITPDGGLVNIEGSVAGRFTNCVFRNATSTYSSTSVWAYPLVLFRGDKNLIFENCEFSNLTMSDDNSIAIGIGGVQYPQQQNNFSFNNCLFNNNTSPGGIIGVNSKNNPNMSFTNCTFAGNESNTYTLATNGNVDITNTIFYNNSPYQIQVVPQTVTGETTTLNIDYSNIKNGMAGIQQAPGNTINYHPTSISNNPRFLGGDDIHNPQYYSLSSVSLCIDAGTPDTLGLFLLPYDLAGNVRVWNGRIDMGCFEYGSLPYVGVDDPELPPPPGGFRVSVYPNPLLNTSRAAGVFIEFTLPKKPASQPEIEIYNIRGQKVRSICVTESNHSIIDKTGLSGDLKQNGELYSSVWNGKDDNDRSLASGTYIIRAIADQKVATTKITIIK